MQLSQIAVLVLIALGAVCAQDDYIVISYFTSSDCSGDATYIDAAPASSAGCLAISCTSDSDVSYTYECWTGTPDIDVANYVIIAEYTSTATCGEDPDAITAYSKDCVESAPNTGIYDDYGCSGSNVTVNADCDDTACTTNCIGSVTFPQGCVAFSSTSTCYTGCTSDNQCYTPSGDLESGSTGSDAVALKMPLGVMAVAAMVLAFFF